MKKVIICTILMFSVASFSNRLVCIAGGSASGKSTYVRKMKQQLGERAVILELDRYYVEHSGTIEEKKQFNWDHPTALDWDLLKEHLMTLKNEKSVEVPVRDFMNFARAAHTDQLKPAEVILFEGIHALYDDSIRAICDEKYFIDASEEVRLERRTKRDARERNRTPEETQEAFLKTVKPMHDEYIEPVKKHPGVIVLQESDL